MTKVLAGQKVSVRFYEIDIVMMMDALKPFGSRSSHITNMVLLRKYADI